MEQEKDAAYLASTLEHHSVVLRKGAEAKCTRLGFQLAPDDDLSDFEKQVVAHGIKTSRKKDAEPTISDMLVFDNLKGTVMEVFKMPQPLNQPFSRKGIVPHSSVTLPSMSKTRKRPPNGIAMSSLFRSLGLDGRFLLVPALRH